MIVGSRINLSIPDVKHGGGSYGLSRVVADVFPPVVVSFPPRLRKTDKKAAQLSRAARPPVTTEEVEE